MDPLSYPWQKFSSAIYSLAGEGSLQSRIGGAYATFHVLQVEHFKDHPDLWDQYQQIIDRLTVIKNPDEGYAAATLEQMPDDEACEVITMILDLAFMIAEARLKKAHQNSN
jgi:hypothetical protein